MDSVTHAASGALFGMAVAQLAIPEAMVACIVVGTIAGSLPDLDFLAEFRGKIAAWKFHRILTHNIPVAFSLTLLLAGLASYTQGLPVGWMLVLCIGATSLHLLLDVLTSFGTCLLHPFSGERYSTRSHFIVDPFILAICVYGLVGPYAWQSMIALMVYIGCSVLLKSLVQAAIEVRLPVDLAGLKPQLEPMFLAPLRWLVIIETEKGYVYRYQNLFWPSQWYSQDHESGEFVALCLQHELMRHVLKTFDMPLYQLRTHDGEQYLIVEDLKWRSEPGLRPLAFTLHLERVDDGWNIKEATQGGFFQRSDSVLFLPALKWANSQ